MINNSNTLLSKMRKNQTKIENYIKQYNAAIDLLNDTGNAILEKQKDSR